MAPPPVGLGLSQGSKHEDRIFLDKKERDQFCKLLTSEISVNEFSSKVSFLSKNANLLQKIVIRLKEKNPENIPISIY